MDKEIYQKLQKTKILLERVFFHKPYYLESVLAAFASDSNIMLLGYRGGGKTHLMESLLKMIDENIVSKIQGYLSAELEDIFARLDIPELFKGKEEVIFKKATLARVKGFDEIQRLGAGALSGMFRLLTEGTVIYTEKEHGVFPFWCIATANPQEVSNDVLNIRLPEPLYDRFDAVLWIPIAPLKYQRKINGNVEKLKKALPVIWKENDLLRLWEDCEKVKVPSEIDLIITLINRIMQYCQYAQEHDGSSLKPEQKRELCSKCNKGYLCSRLARPPSTRAKLALLRLAKGFAYVNGRDTVTLEDVRKAFPLVYWKRIEFMNEFEIANRLKALQDFFEDIKKEIMEVHEGIKLVQKLKQEFNSEDYAKLQFFANSKGWFKEVVDEVEDYFKEVQSKLEDKFNTEDLSVKAKVYFVAKKKLPPEIAEKFYFDHKVKLKLNKDTIAKFAKISRELFSFAKTAYSEGKKEIELNGEYALAYLAFFGDNSKKA